MPEIKIISKGIQHLCLYDQEDHEFVSQHTWHVLNGYAATYINGKRYFMHRIFLSLDDPETFGDHIDHNPLNNQRSNLRTCTRAENRRNSRKLALATSGYKGTYFEKERGLFHAQIGYDNRMFNLGRYHSELSSAKAYDRRAIQVFGAYAHVNFESSKEARQLAFDWI